MPSAFPSVVRSGCKDREVWPCQAQGNERNHGSLFPRHFPFSLLYFSALVLFLFRGTIWSVITSGRLPPLSSTIFMPRRIFLMAEEGSFLGLGPSPKCRHSHGPPGLLPPTISIKKTVCKQKFDSF